MHHIQIKICGFTIPEQAQEAVSMGADAIGLIFYSRSPRNLAIDQAAAIVAALPDDSKAVGVFVEMDAEKISDIAEKTGIKKIQLHNDASDDMISELENRGFFVIQVLRTAGKELLEKAFSSIADSVLVECPKGILPGGNGIEWDWSSVSGLSEIRPFILAGGLSPENAVRALASSGASGLDVCSGVELSPGVKDIKKIRKFIEAVKKFKPLNKTGKVLS